MFMHKCMFFMCGVLMLLGSSVEVYAHGTPLGISVVNGNLTVDTSLYFDPNLGKFNTLGPFRYTNLPALGVDDMQPSDILNYRFLPRTSINNPNDSRFLWYWNGSTMGSSNSDLLSIENSESPSELVNLPQNLSLIDNELLAANITSEILDEPDSHVLNFYVQTNARTGVYGFYGRFESPGYGASEPFWLLINNGLDLSTASGAPTAFTTQTIPISPGPATVTWNKGSGVWNTVTGNWTGGTPTENLYKQGDNAVFNNSAPGGTVTIQAGGVSPTSITVNNDSSHPYIFQNVGTAGIKTGSLIKSGAGTLTLDNINTYTGTTTVDGGLLNVSLTGSIDASTTINVSSTGALLTNHILTTTLILDGNATIRANGGSAGTSKVETLSINAGGKLNLKDNDLVVGTAANVIAVRAAIKLGIAGLTGITSDVAGFSITTGFGYAFGNDSSISPLLSGSHTLTDQSYDADSILVKYTFLGDADLDGDSDLNDLGLWAQSFTGDLGNPAIPATYWTSGDFDYDGDTDLNDLGFWAGTFTGDLGGGAGSFIVNAPGASPEAVVILNQMGITVVPEPSMIAVIGVSGIVALVTMMRRKRFS